MENKTTVNKNGGARATDGPSRARETKASDVNDDPDGPPGWTCATVSVLDPVPRRFTAPSGPGGGVRGQRIRPRRVFGKGLVGGGRARVQRETHYVQCAEKSDDVQRAIFKEVCMKVEPGLA